MCLFNVKDGFLGACPRPAQPLPAVQRRRGAAGASWRAPALPAARANSRARPHAPLPVAEAVVRGYKLGLLTTSDYNNLCQCETLEDIKLYLVGAARACVLRWCQGIHSSFHSAARAGNYSCVRSLAVLAGHAARKRVGQVYAQEGGRRRGQLRCRTPPLGRLHSRQHCT